MTEATISQDHIVQNIPVDQIYSDPTFNCRQSKIVPFDVQDLAQSIHEYGLTQPITIQPYKNEHSKKFRIVIGHRRFQAVLNLGSDTIPAIIKKDLSETSARILNLTENLIRKNLNVYQEAKSIEHFLLEGMSREEVANKLDVSTGWVQVRATVLQLPYEIQKEVAAGYITQTQIKDIYGLKDRDKMFEAVRNLKDKEIRNSKAKIVIKKPSSKLDTTKKKIQSTGVVFQMQQYLMNTLGPSLTTRFSAWALGEITTQEFLDSVYEECQEKKVEYKLPTWIK